MKDLKLIFLFLLLFIIWCFPILGTIIGTLLIVKGSSFSIFVGSLAIFLSIVCNIKQLITYIFMDLDKCIEKAKNKR